MIEKRYTGIAKQGADVVANPTLDGSEQALNSIRINGENFKIEGGGSGKLKLVATATQDEQNPKLFHPNKQLEYGKLYYIVYEDDFVGFSSSTLMLIKDYEKENLSIDNSSTLLATDEEESTKFAKIIYSYSTNTFMLSFIDDYTLDVLEGHNQINLQIYELEFGGSSGGGSSDSNKLKLVDEGQLIYNAGDYFELPYQLENGKYYSIQIWTESFCRIIFNGLYYRDELFSSVSKDNANDNFIGLSIIGSEMYFWNKDSDVANDIYKENSSYKIYELPFSL